MIKKALCIMHYALPLRSRLWLVTALQLCIACAAWAQEAKNTKIGFKFYGRIRGELMYNSRASQESVDGLFYMYPLDKKPDYKGNDLNAVPASNFYMLYSRLGIDISAPSIFNAKATAKVEVDFRGSGTSYALFRMRQAYMMLAWEHHNLLVGQTWHPLTGDITPTMLNLSTGAPYQPFSRTPMLRYRYKTDFGLTATAAALWQMQYNSAGPVDNKQGAASTKSYNFIKNSCVPEIYIGADYKYGDWLMGVGAEMLSITPRQTSYAGQNILGMDMVYKVKERITTFAVEAHVKYTTPMWHVTAKGIWGSNLAHTSMLGGYAVSAIDRRTGEQEYTPFRHLSGWVNFVYGKKWQPSAFLGYTSNYGTTKNIVGAKYGTGLDIDQLMSVGASISYNLPHWKVGAEIMPSVAWYGFPDNRGIVGYTHAVANCRLLAVAMFIF